MYIAIAGEITVIPMVCTWYGTHDMAHNANGVIFKWYMARIVVYGTHGIYSRYTWYSTHGIRYTWVIIWYPWYGIHGMVPMVRYIWYNTHGTAHTVWYTLHGTHEVHMYMLAHPVHGTHVHPADNSNDICCLNLLFIPHQ